MVFLLGFDVTPRSTSPTITQDAAVATRTPLPAEGRAESEPRPQTPVSKPLEQRLASREPNENVDEFLEPIATPPEFDYMPGDPIFWHEDLWRELHAKLEREPRDPDWAPVAESTLSSVVNAHPDITTYGRPEIHCRTEMCQIQLLAYGGDDIDAEEWMFRVAAVHEEVRDSFGVEDISVAQEGGLTAIVVYLSK